MSTPSGEKEGDERLKLVHCNTTAGPGESCREHPIGSTLPLDTSLPG